MVKLFGKHKPGFPVYLLSSWFLFFLFSLIPFVPLAALPFVLSGMTKGARYSGALLLAGATGIYIASGSNVVMYIYVAFFAVPGILAGKLLELRCTAYKASLVVGFSVLLTGVVTVFVLTGPGPTALFDNMMKESLQQTVTLYESAGVPAGQLEDGISYIKYVFSNLYPLLLAVGISYALVVNTWALRFLSKYVEGLRVPRCRFRWLAYSPWFVLIFIAAAMLLLFNGWSGKSEQIQFLGENLLGISLLLYFIQGLAIMTGYMESFGLGKMFRIVAYMFCFYGFMPVTVASVGLFDIWFDFRKFLRG